MQKTEWNKNISYKKFQVTGGSNSKKNCGRIKPGNVLYLKKDEVVQLRKKGYKLEQYIYCGNIDYNYTLDKILNTYKITVEELWII